jgi:hypothetical protein
MWVIAKEFRDMPEGFAYDADRLKDAESLHR